MVLFILGTRFQPNPIVDRSLMVTGAQGDAVAQASAKLARLLKTRSIVLG
jgi:hypothetical protein